MRKGISSGILILVLLLVGVYELYYVTSVATSGARIGVKNYQEDIYAMANSLDPAKEYAEISLRYSVYQSCYDILGNGGWDPENIPPDKVVINNEEEYALLSSEDDFISALSESVLNNLNKYVNDKFVYMGTYDVEMPKYESVNLNMDEDSFSVKATSQEPLSIKRYIEKFYAGENLLELKKIAKEDQLFQSIELMGDSEIEEDLDKSCYSIFTTGMEKEEELRDQMKLILDDKASNLGSSVERNVDIEKCREMITSEEADATNTIMLLSSLGTQITPLKLDLGYELQTEPPLATGEDGKFPCLFTKKRDPSVLALVQITDPESKKHPIFDGDSVIMNNYELSFVTMA